MDNRLSSLAVGKVLATLVPASIEASGPRRPERPSMKAGGE